MKTLRKWLLIIPILTLCCIGVQLVTLMDSPSQLKSTLSTFDSNSNYLKQSTTVSGAALATTSATIRDKTFECSHDHVKLLTVLAFTSDQSMLQYFQEATNNSFHVWAIHNASSQDTFNGQFNVQHRYIDHIASLNMHWISALLQCIPTRFVLVISSGDHSKNNTETITKMFSVLTKSGESNLVLQDSDKFMMHRDYFLEALKQSPGSNSENWKLSMLSTLYSSTTRPEFVTVSRTIQSHRDLAPIIHQKTGALIKIPQSDSLNTGMLFVIPSEFVTDSDTLSTLKRIAKGFSENLLDVAYIIESDDDVDCDMLAIKLDLDSTMCFLSSPQFLHVSKKRDPFTLVNQYLMDFKTDMIFISNGVSTELNEAILASVDDETVVVPIRGFEWSDLEPFTKLSIASITAWKVPRVKIIVLTYNRPESLARLCTSLLQASYLSDEISIYFNVEANADDVTMQYVQDFEWPHGRKDVRTRLFNGGLMASVVESWDPQMTRDEYAVILEDDIEVSLLWYIWAKVSLLRYRYSNEASDLNDRLVGISLYTPRVQELTFPPQPIRFDELFSGQSQFVEDSPFLWQVPCSWGAIYFPEKWIEFRKFIRRRLGSSPSRVLIENNEANEQEQAWTSNLIIPNSRSNVWKQSWKKYFIEMMVLRSYVMMYPNMPDQASFSTNHLEPGAHIQQGSDVRENMLDQFQVPLIQRRIPSDEDLDETKPELKWQLSALESMPILNLLAVRQESIEGLHNISRTVLRINRHFTDKL